MPKSVSDTDRLAALASKSGAGDQSFHLDSPEPGNSGVTAYDEDQDIYILWNSFIAMVILGELRADREEATALLRSCWNPSSGCSDAEWDLLEPSASFAFRFGRPRRSWWTPALHMPAVAGTLPPAALVFTGATFTGFAKTCCIGPFPFWPKRTRRSQWIYATPITCPSSPGPSGAPLGLSSPRNKQFRIARIATGVACRDRMPCAVRAYCTPVRPSRGPTPPESAARRAASETEPLIFMLVYSKN